MTNNDWGRDYPDPNFGRDLGGTNFGRNLGGTNVGRTLGGTNFGMGALHLYGTYAAIVLATRRSNLLGYWPLADPVGPVATDLSGYARNGVYSNVALEQPGSGDGNPAASFNGTSSFVDLYSAPLAAVFNGQELSVSLWFKVSAAGVWNDATLRRIFALLADASNRTNITKLNGATTLQADYRAGGSTKSVNFSTRSVRWMHACHTASKTADQFKFYVDGVQIGKTQTGLGTWAGAPNPINTVLGSVQTVPTANLFSGLEQHVAMYSAALTATEVAQLAARPWWAAQPVFFGDSITWSSGASAEAAAYPSLVAAVLGWGDNFFNEGLGGTVLQNTVQNKVATLAAAADFNGRDSYVNRVLSHRPTDVFILYGLNDMRLNDAAFTVANFQNDLTEVVDGLIAWGLPASRIRLGSLPYIPSATYALFTPFNGGSALKHGQYNAAVQAVATSRGCKYAAVYEAMSAIGDTLISADGLHPNDTGHAVIANAFVAAA